MIRFGVGPAGAGEERASLRERAARVLAEALGAEASVVALSDYKDLLAGLEGGDLQLAWLPPVLCTRAIDHGCELLLRFAREEGTFYHGAIFVPSSIKKYRPEELEGARVAWVDPLSCGGYLFPRAELKHRSIDPRELFSSETMLGSHAAVVHAVKSGEADCGAAYFNLLADGRARGAWEAGSMRCVLASRPIPSDGICAAKGFGRGAELARLHEREDGQTILRELFEARRLEPADPAHLDPVREALALVG